MHETIQKMVQVFAKQREQRRRACAAFTALAILVSVSTTWLLVQPANTLAAEYVCGMEEHVHTDECYAWICGDEAEEAPGMPEADGETVEDEAPVEEPAGEESPGEAPDGENPTAPEAAAPVAPEVSQPVDPAPAAPEVSQPAGPAPAAPEVSQPADPEPVAPEVSQPAGPEPVAPEVSQPAGPEPAAPEVSQPAHPEPAAPEVSQPAHPEPAAPEVSQPAAPEPAAEAGDETMSGKSLDMAMVMYTNESGETESEPVSAPAPVEESKAEEPAVEEPVKETPVQEEPKAEGPVVEEPVVEESAGENSDGEPADREEPAVDGGPVVEESSGSHGHEHAKEGHVHTSACRRGKLICGKEEHIHSEACMSLMNLLEDLGELPEGYHNEFSVLGDGYTVAVFAPDGALPEGAELVAELFEEGSEGYERVEKTLEAMVAQEVEVNVGGVMPEEALAEAAAAAEETPAVPEKEEKITPEAPVVEEPADGGNTDAGPTIKEPVSDDVQDDGEADAPAPVEEEPLTASLVHNDNAPAEEAQEETAETAEAVGETDEAPDAESVEEVTEGPVPYEDEFHYDGFVALDIHFEVDGEEIEPAKPVFVYIDIKGLLPEGVDPESVTILHQKEVVTEEKTVEEPVVESVEVVADNTVATGAVATAESYAEAAMDVTTLFAVDSFSTFLVKYDLKEGSGVEYIRKAFYDRLDQSSTMRNTQVVLSDMGLVTLTSTGDDPWIWFNLSASINTADYPFAVVTYDADNSMVGNMQMFPVGEHNSSGANGSYCYQVELETTGYFNYSIIDLSGYQGRIDKIRFDYTTAASGSIVVDSVIFCDSLATANRVGQERDPDAAHFADVTDSGVEDIEFHLFDYSGNINLKEDGTYSTLANYFTFRNSDVETESIYKDNGTYINAAVDEDGYTVNRALVRPNLGSDGFPVFDATRDNGGTFSLNHLFNPSTSHHAVTAYSPNNTILQMDGTHYYYNSADNAVDYDTSENYFRVRGYGERNSCTAGYSGYADFMPFDYSLGTAMGTNASTGETYHLNRYTVNYWYGMTMQFDFKMQENGRITVLNGDGSTSTENMVFNFSGDDDVWVFVDNVLVLDLGGTHGTVDGSIDFATGQVLQYLSWGGANTPQSAQTAGDTCFPTTLKGCFEKAGATPNGGWNGDIFNDYTTHTLKFFYMERGAAIANCKLDFNMPVVPDKSLTIEKNVEDTYDAIPDDTLYGFKVWKADMNGNKTDELAVSDIIELRAGESISINDMLNRTDEEAGYKYVVEELGEKIVDATTGAVTYSLEHYGTHWATSGVDQEDGTVTDAFYAGDSRVIVFTNHVKAGVLEVSKDVYINGVESNTGHGDFTFELHSQNLANMTIDGVKFNKDGIANITVAAGEAKTIAGIPAGVKIVVTEKNYDGYAPSWSYDENGAYTHGGACEVTIPVDTTRTVYFRNTTGPVLPSTGGMGTNVFTTLGTVMMLGAGVLLLDQRRRKLSAC